MVKEKKEIEERERKAVSELWRYQGEAKNVRLKADEVRLCEIRVSELIDVVATFVGKETRRGKVYDVAETVGGSGGDVES